MSAEDNDQKPARAFGRQLEDFWLPDSEGISDPLKQYENRYRLHVGEWELLRCAALGQFCVLGQELPLFANTENTIRADLLRFMVLGGDAKHPLHDHGVGLVGAFVRSELDLMGCVVPENLTFLKCTFESDIVFMDCCAETLAFRSCNLQGVSGDRLEVTGSLHLDQGMRAKGAVRLHGAKVGGDLHCSASQFEGSDVSLSCDGIEIKGGVFLRDGFAAYGTVRLLGAKIGGNLECDASRFKGSAVSLACDGIEIKGGVFLRDGFAAHGTVRLLGAKVGGDLGCRNGKFLGRKLAINGEGATIQGAALLDHGFLALGTVDLTDMQIGTNLRCTNGTFSAKEVAIDAPNLKVGNSIYLNEDCRIRGEISLQSAEIGDSVTFQGGWFETKGVINLRNAKIGNMLTWRGVNHMRGELNLAGATCKSLNMDEKTWLLPSQIRLDSFVFERFAELPSGCDPAFWKRWLERQPTRHLTSKFRPNPYQQLSKVLEDMGHEEEAREVRIDRRERQRLFTRHHVPMPDDPFRTGVRHLADFWRWVQKKVIGHGYRPGFAVVWLSAMVVIGAGIYQWAACKGIMAPTHPLIFKEAIWNGDISELPPGKIPQACRENWVYPPDEINTICSASVASEYSTFNALVYSLDTAIPVVNFRMENDWSPRVVQWETGLHDWTGWWVRVWEWLQIGLGWAFSLLFVSAISGVIRRD